MTTYSQLDDLPPLTGTIALSIGTFDGVHLGHQDLLFRMKQMAHKAVLIAFTLPPHRFFRPNDPFDGLITSLPLKLGLLKAHGADIVLSIPFTADIAKMTYREFLDYLRPKIPFTHLVLGKGSVFGAKREGTEENMRKYASDLGIEYIEKKIPASSSAIRQKIVQGDLNGASRLLGRPFALLLPSSPHKDPILCLPPKGVYSTLEGPILTLAEDRTLTLSYSPRFPCLISLVAL